MAIAWLEHCQHSYSIAYSMATALPA